VTVPTKKEDIKPHHSTYPPGNSSNQPAPWCPLPCLEDQHTTFLPPCCMGTPLPLCIQSITPLMSNFTENFSKQPGDNYIRFVSLKSTWKGAEDLKRQPPIKSKPSSMGALPSACFQLNFLLFLWPSALNQIHNWIRWSLALVTSSVQQSNTSKTSITARHTLPKPNPGCTVPLYHTLLNVLMQTLSSGLNLLIQHKCVDYSPKVTPVQLLDQMDGKSGFCATSLIVCYAPFST